MSVINQDMAKEIKALYEELKMEYGANIGIRVQENVPFTVGPMDHVSHVWVDGEETDDELDGVCAISLSFPGWEHLASMYCGAHVALIAGDVAGYGDDAGEIILSDAEVIAVLG